MDTFNTVSNLIFSAVVFHSLSNTMDIAMQHLINYTAYSQILSLTHYLKLEILVSIHSEVLRCNTSSTPPSVAVPHQSLLRLAITSFFTETSHRIQTRETIW